MILIHESQNTVIQQTLNPSHFMASFSLSIIEILEPQPQAESGRTLQILIYDSVQLYFFNVPEIIFLAEKLVLAEKKDGRII
jgi:hypothetical protein